MSTLSISPSTSESATEGSSPPRTLSWRIDGLETEAPTGAGGVAFEGERSFEKKPFLAEGAGAPERETAAFLPLNSAFRLAAVTPGLRVPGPPRGDGSGPPDDACRPMIACRAARSPFRLMASSQPLRSSADLAQKI